MSCYIHVIQCQIISFLLLCHVFLNECRFDSERIIGGKPASIKDYPYIAAIVIRYELHSSAGDFRGAAIIVSKHWALTASHCLMQFAAGILESGFVYLRSNTDIWNIEENKKYNDHKIIESYTHPNYSTMSNYDCDIGVIKVKEPFNGRYEKPIKVAGKYFRNNLKEIATVIGWGTTNYEVQIAEEQLRSVSITIFRQEVCVHAYSKTRSLAVTKNMICGGSDTGGKDACNGDSGGPLVHLGVLIGIVSYGQNCGLREYPGVYTKVAAFHDWLVTLEKRLKTTFDIRYIGTKQGKFNHQNISRTNSRHKKKHLLINNSGKV